LTFLRRIGVEPKKEPEVHHCCRLPFGGHYYYGQFFFEGRIVKGPRGDRLLPDGKGFEILTVSLTKAFSVGFHPYREFKDGGFATRPFVVMEFTVTLSWRISRPEPI
jgi:hypothetical protein